MYDIHDEIVEAATTAATQPKPSLPTTPPAPPAPPPPKHSPWLLKKAEQFGIHPVVVDKLSSEELNQVVLEHVAMQLENQRHFTQSQVLDTTNRPPQAIQPTATQVPGQPTAVATEPTLDWGTIEDEDPRTGQKVVRPVEESEIYKPIAKLFKEQQKRIAALEEEIRQSRVQTQAAVERTVEQKFEDAFAKFPQLFGQGTGASLKGTPEFERRRVVYQYANSIPAEQRANMTIEQAVDQVTKLLFAVEAASNGQAPSPQQVPQNGKKSPIDAWNSGVLASPTKRVEGSMPRGEKLARENIAAVMRDMAAQGDNFGETTEDEFL